MNGYKVVRLVRGILPESFVSHGQTVTLAQGFGSFASAALWASKNTDGRGVYIERA